MKLHNKLIIKKRGEEYQCFNNLLLPAIEAIQDFSPYTNHLAIGCGGAATVEGQERLENYIKTYPLAIKAYNFDPAMGELYVTKELVLDASDRSALEIRELGLAVSNEASPRIANRFLSNGGEPIYRDPGEEMSFEVTVYLTLGENLSLVPTAGENPLIRLLLGDWQNGAIDFGMAKGYDKTANHDIIARDVVGLEVESASISCTLDGDLGVLSMKLVADLGDGLVDELLLVANGLVVARVNTAEVAGSSDGLSVTVIADGDNLAALNKPGVNQISSVVDNTTGEAVENYTTRQYATSFLGGFQEIFENLGYTKSTTRKISKEGDVIGFMKDNKVYIYDFSSGAPVQRDTSVCDATNVYLWTIIADELLLKYNDNGTYGVRFYRHNPTTNKYEVKAYQLKVAATFYPGVNADSAWNDVDVARIYDGDDDLIMYGLSGTHYLFAYITTITQGNLFQRSYKYTSLYKHNYIKAMLRTNRLSQQFVIYDQKKSKMVAWTGSSYKEFTDPVAVDIVTNFLDAGFPLAAKNYAFAVDNENKCLKAFSIDTGMATILNFDMAEKIFVSDNLEYLATVDASGATRAYYLDGSLNTYEFGGGVPRVDGATIEDIIFVGPTLIEFLSDGRIMKINLNLNKFIISGVEKGHEIAITYAADNTPGISGGNVRANVTLEARI